MHRRLIGLLILCAIAFSVGGCLYDFPLSGPSSNIDTRLLGVFESRKAPKAGGGAPADRVEVQRVAVVPLDENHYSIYYRDYSKQPLKTLRFTGWISRVGKDYFLSIRDDNEGLSSFGKHAFFRYDWSWPGDIVLTAPDMKGSENETSFELRRSVRQKLRDATLFPYEGIVWRKLARIHWNWPSKDHSDEIPASFDTGENVYAPVEAGKGAQKKEKGLPD